MKLSGEVKWFAEEMQKRLNANNHKDGWHDSHDAYLLGRAYQELVELTEALRTTDAQKIAREAADVANFCMMLADNAQCE